MQEQVSERTGFLFEEAWDDVDPESARITAFEEARQVNKLIMIASESVAPPAVRRALGSVFTDLYAEGYPAAHTTREPEDLIGDVPYQSAYFHRYGDRRYYKGTEFADLIEALAQNRIRHLFAPNRFPHNPIQIGPDQIQANVQPWSGANANTAVYLALLQPGDTIMGMNLAQGGHLSHGSPVNLSGKLFKVVPYGVDPDTGRIDYDEVERLAREHNPRLIVSGASAYPWDIDFLRLRKICDSLPRKAYLMADISHPAGLAVAGLFPNPVGIADVTTFTTHKTLIGPRAAVILTTSESLSRRIDRSVFPGLQGGPHLNTIAALAVAFKIAEQPAFLELQRTIVANAKALAEVLSHRGLKIAYGGTNTHLLLVDVRAIPEPSGVPLNGEVAARILDRCGIVCNKNTIAGDTSATFPSGIRLGTPWLTQRGLTPDDMRTLGNIIADVLFGIETFSYFDRGESAGRGKIRLDVLKRARAGVADLIARRAVGPSEPDGWPAAYCPPPTTFEGRELIQVVGRRARQFLSEATDGSVWALSVGEARSASLLDAEGRDLGSVGVLRRVADQFSMDHFVCAVDPSRRDGLVDWLDALSDGLALFDPADPGAKIDGPVAVSAFTGELSPAETDALHQALSASPGSADLSKPYFVGQRALAARLGPPVARPRCVFPEAPSAASLLRSRQPAASTYPADGWTMPRSYGDAEAELKALRETAGLIDETPIGVLEISGPDAGRFLDLVTTNDVAFLAQNAAQYAFLLDPEGDLIGDALLYRVDRDRYLLTTSPSRSSRVAHWLGEALAHRCRIDDQVPTRTLPTNLRIRDVRNAGDATARAIVGLTGPNALNVLRALADTPEDRRKVGRIRRFTLAFVRLAGVEAMVARTGHTGQTHEYEIFVPPSAVEALWDAALARGTDQGVQPVGWDAFRAEGIAAGLPWDGHELNGELRISPVQAGYGGLTRIHKPFFVGRAALLSLPYPVPREIVRFQVMAPVVALPREGDPLIDPSGTCVGLVTSEPRFDSLPIGLAYAEARSTPLGAQLSVLVGAGSGTRVGDRLEIGEQSRPIATVEILARFPK